MEGSSSSPPRSAIPALLLTLVLFTSCMTFCSAARAVAGGTDTRFIKTSCGATTYPELCFSSLSGYASAIQTSPKLLANTSLSVALNHARSTMTTMTTMSKAQGMKPGEIGAMRDCVEEITESVDELQKSLAEMGLLSAPNMQLQMSDIQTWVSAAMTDENTCVDGFAGNVMNGNVKTTARGLIVNMAHLTSNALALINSYASTQATSP